MHKGTSTLTKRQTPIWQVKGSLPHPVLYSYYLFTCQMELWDDGPFPRVLVTLEDGKHLTTMNCIVFGPFIALRVDLALSLFA